MENPSNRMSTTSAIPGSQPVSRAAPPGYPPQDSTLHGHSAVPGYGSDQERNKRLRELRDEIQTLKSVLDQVREGESTLQEYAAFIQKTRLAVETLLKDIPGADPVRHVANVWQQIAVSPVIQNPEVDLETQTLLLHLTMIDTLCDKIVLQVGMITIPERVNEWLEMERPGYYIPFHVVFEDELPKFEDRVRVLNYLAWAPKALRGGLIDVERGFIYRYSLEKKRRQLSFLEMLAALLAATLLVAAACYLPIKDWPIQPSHLASMLVGWAAVLVGIGVHIAVGTAKRAQAHEGRPPIIAVSDIFLLIDARFGYILMKILLALVGFFGLVFTAGADQVTPFNMFLVGYSLDSVVEVFSASLEQRASAQMSAFKQQIEVELD